MRLEGEGDSVYTVGPLGRIEVDSAQANSVKTHIGEEVIVGIRPEDFVLVEGSGIAMMEGVVGMAEPLGGEINLHLKTATGDSIVATMPPDHDFAVGDTVRLSFKPNKLKFFDKETEMSLLDKEFYKSVKVRGRNG